jgi:hypothetical protein
MDLENLLRPQREFYFELANNYRTFTQAALSGPGY